MALANYYNLNEKKKQILLDSIKYCLEKDTYDNLTINDIVKKANIARGSFYNYFIDKNDAVTTFVASRLYLFEDTFKEMILKSQNSFFKGIIKTYDLIINSMTNEMYLTIIKNMQYFIELATRIFNSNDFADELDDFLEWAVKNTNEGKTYLNSKKKMANIIEMVIILYLNSILKETIKPKLNTKYTDFKYKLQVIENGAKVS